MPFSDVCSHELLLVSLDCAVKVCVCCDHQDTRGIVGIYVICGEMIIKSGTSRGHAENLNLGRVARAELRRPDLGG